MNIEVGDFVTRKSHENDIIFKVTKINNDIVYLKGSYVRLYADAELTDLVKITDVTDDFVVRMNDRESKEDYFYLPGKILHLDGDDEYLDQCLKFYKKLNIFAIGKKLNEQDMPNQVLELLKEFKPDILVITGHDAYYPDKVLGYEYKNSVNFVKTIHEARKYEKSHEKLVIIAGACQSDYEKLILAGANFASSPKRINIHALDPAIIASNIALTKRNNLIDLKNILGLTKYGSDGMGGIITNGLMYVGFPR